MTTKDRIFAYKFFVIVLVITYLFTFIGFAASYQHPWDAAIVLAGEAIFWVMLYNVILLETIFWFLNKRINKRKLDRQRRYR
jgi:hypothetical protein